MSHPNPTPSRCEAGFWFSGKAVSARRCCLQDLQESAASSPCASLMPCPQPAPALRCRASLSSSRVILCSREPQLFLEREGKLFSVQGRMFGNVFLHSKGFMAFARQARCSLNTHVLSAASFHTGENHPGKNSGRQLPKLGRQKCTKGTRGSLTFSAAAATLKAPRT